MQEGRQEGKGTMQPGQWCDVFRLRLDRVKLLQRDGNLRRKIRASGKKTGGWQVIARCSGAGGAERQVELAERSAGCDGPKITRVAPAAPMQALGQSELFACSLVASALAPLLLPSTDRR